MRLFFFVVAVVLSACRAPASGEKRAPIDFEALPGPTLFSDEATLLSRWPGSLKERHERGEKGTFAGVDGVEIAYVIHRVPSPKAAVVLVTGRTEPVRKYAELIDDLNVHGYSTYAMDHRGQGASGRMLPNRDKGHVVSFQDYVSDLHRFVTTVVAKDTAAKRFLVAHSMGGAVGVLTIDAFPDDFAAAVLSSPMLEVETGAFPAVVASTLAATACGASDGTAYAVGSGDFREETDFSKSGVTKSLPRFDWKRLLFSESPELRLGGLTWKWLCESLSGSSAAERVGAFSTTPTLILQAENDIFVRAGGQNRYCAAARACQIWVAPDGLHEHYAERDALRNKAIEYTLKFLGVEVAR